MDFLLVLIKLCLRKKAGLRGSSLSTKGKILQDTKSTFETLLCFLFLSFIRSSVSVVLCGTWAQVCETVFTDDQRFIYNSCATLESQLQRLSMPGFWQRCCPCCRFQHLVSASLVQFVKKYFNVS